MYLMSQLAQIWQPTQTLVNLGSTNQLYVEHHCNSIQSGCEIFHALLRDVISHLPYLQDYGNEEGYCCVIFTFTS